MFTVDSHQHYWKLDQFDYRWINPVETALYQDRLPPHLRPTMQAAGIDRAVIVQAANVTEEIPWMLRLSDENPYIAGVIGWIDLASRNVHVPLEGFARHPRFKGIRLHLPITPRNRSALNDGMRALAHLNLSCDLLCGVSSIPQAIDLITAHPDVTFILDHLGGVRIRLGGEIEYANIMAPLSSLTNAVMKLSGYFTRDADASGEAMAPALVPYLEVALRIFGSERLMFGSDWPVCTVTVTYPDAVASLRRSLRLVDATDEMQAAIFGQTAIRVYRLG